MSRKAILSLILLFAAAVPAAAYSGAHDVRSLRQLAAADLVVVGTVEACETRLLPDNATAAELAERGARGGVPGALLTDCKIRIDEVWKGRAPSGTVTVTQPGGRYGGAVLSTFEEPLFAPGGRELLFLTDVSGDRVWAPGRAGYMAARGTRFRVGEDGMLSSSVPGPVAGAYAGRELAHMAADFHRVAAAPPEKLSREEALKAALDGTHLVVEGRIAEVSRVRLLPDEGKPQAWIDQMLAEGKVPGQLVTEYAVEVERVLHSGELPGRRPVAAGDVITVARWGGRYRGVTQTEAGPPLSVGGREVLLLRDLAVYGEEDPRWQEGRVFYGLTDSKLGRFRIDPEGRLTAFSERSLGSFYHGRKVELLARDLEQHAAERRRPAPERR
ncbi:MAG TPA: hypothetical protein VN493_24630 [Thermoanaerobaculia bacterium]|nr:hypothetical protein [Thermoanaerobaculia bacterium]